MRRVSLKQRLQNTRHADDCLRRTLIWKEWKRLKRGGSQPKKVTVLRDGKKTTAWAHRRVSMPSVFCLDENTDETIKFLAEMRFELLSEAVKMRGRRRLPRHVRMYFDFKALTKISPTAALVLAAIFDRRKAITGLKPTTIDEDQWDTDVLSMLRSVGLHELLEMQPWNPDSESDQDIRILKFVSGEKAESEEVGALQEALANFLPTDERERLLYAEPYSGMIEAALNSYMWAYPADQKWDFPSVPRWWMTGAIDTRNRTATVAVYDQGISIPASLPHWAHWSKIERMVQRLASGAGLTNPIGDPQNDAAAIRLAMAVARSKTGLPQHGKGLNTMLEVAGRARRGRLRILSRNGEYVWETGKKAYARSHPHSIGGTLVEWRLQL